jgi:hypothetical protein
MMLADMARCTRIVAAALGLLAMNACGGSSGGSNGDAGPDAAPDASADPDRAEVAPGRSALDIATQYAPVWYHDTATGGPDNIGARADYPTTIDYDSDLQHNNNWDNLPTVAPTSAIYYAIIATETHFFLNYAQYHPRDWESVCSGLFTECHEGDMEAIRLVVARDPGLERVVAVTSESHGETYLWTAGSGDIAAKVDGPPIDGAVDFESLQGEISATFDPAHSHLRVFVQAHGHGPIPCRAYETAPQFGYLGFGSNGVRCTGSPGELGFPSGDGIIFVPTGDSVPFSLDLTSGARVGYRLVNVESSLWAWRHDIGAGLVWSANSGWNYQGQRGEPFVLPGALGGRFDADQFANDSVSGTALWYEERPGTQRGDMFFDPAFAWAAQLDFTTAIDDTYSYNPYVFALDATPPN